jgi:hypothetical protein
MKLRILPSLFLFRSAFKELRGIREQLAQQNQLLTRLADHFAPDIPRATREEIAAETGVDYVDPTDQALLQAYVEKVQQSTGHVPTEDELVAYLADEKTIDLHQRLVARDREIERLAVEHRR